MKVKVYLGPLCKGDALDKDGYIEVDEGETVLDILKKIKCPIYIRALGLYMVNYRKVKLDTKLKDGDIISIISPIAGG